MRDAVIVSAVRTASGKAPGGTFRFTRPDEMAATAIRGGARARARPRSSGSRRCHPRLRDAGGRARPERRANRQPPRRRAGVGVRADGQSILLVRAAVDRARRRAHHGRVRRRHRRGRHRVDEPRADGRAQGRAQSGAGRYLPGRLPHDGARRREPRPRSGGDARGTGRVRARQPPEGHRRDRRRPVQRTRSCRSRSRVDSTGAPTDRSASTKGRDAIRRSRRSPS